MLKKILQCSVFYFSCILYPAAITYELNGGRFGDNLSAYLHAKWLSYHYDIPLIYIPFPHSENLRLHFLEKRIKVPKKRVVLTKNFSIDKHADVLYVVPYFSEFTYEHTLPTNRNWIYFPVDWHDKEFKKIVSLYVAPHNKLEVIKPPPNKISVALHIRRGTDYDGQLLLETKYPDKNIGKYTDFHTPLKFLSEEFYIKQIKYIYKINKKKPLYVYIFTDDIDPQKWIEQFKETFKSYAIEFDYRQRTDHYSHYFLEDFFSLLQFDCIIHPLSNFSYIASKLKEFKIQIYPKSFHWDGLKAVIDKIEVKKKK